MVSKVGRELGVVGGALGLIALVLPWAVLTASGFGQYISVGVSPIQMFQGIQDSSSLDTSILPADFLARLEMAGALLVLGVIVYVVGCVISFVRPHGGFIMLGGALIGVVGAFSFGTYGVPLIATISMNPGFGEGLGIIASIIAFSGVFVKEPIKPVVPVQPVPSPFWPPPPPPPMQPPKLTCPRCGSTEFLEGPHGGLAVNLKCVKCGAEYWHAPGWPLTPIRT